MLVGTLDPFRHNNSATIEPAQYYACCRHCLKIKWFTTAEGAEF